MFSRHQAALSEVLKVLVDGGYAGAPLCAVGGRNNTGSVGGGCSAQRIAQVRCYTQALGGGALLRLAGKMSASLEKLRTQTRHQLQFIVLAFLQLLLKR